MFNATFEDAEYKDQFVKRMQDRIEFVKSREVEKAGLDRLPEDALLALENVVKQAVSEYATH